MKSLLVTGCAGFIGAAVCGVLMKSGYRVIGVDSLVETYDVRLKQWRLSNLRESSDFTFARMDIRDQEGLEDLIRSRGVEAVLHLAALAGVRQSLVRPAAYYETNVMGTLNLLELCRKCRIKKFILASTSSLYSGTELPFKEHHPSDRPRSPYAASKKAAETLCYSYHSVFGIDVTVLRYFSVYGPAGRPDMSIFRLIRWIVEGDQVILYGDGTQERDFTFIEDIARGTVLALKPVGYELINLGNDHPVPLRHVITLLEKMLERTARLKQEPSHPADAFATWADIRKAWELLGWRPRTSLEQGLRAAVNWYFANRSWASEIALGGATASSISNRHEV